MAGARHSTSDQQHLNQAAEHLAAAGATMPAMPEPPAPEPMMDAPDTTQYSNARVPNATMSLEADEQIAFGGAVKALGDGKVGGYLVRFTPQNDYDLTQERFDASGDYGDRESVPVLYQHGMDTHMGKRIMAKAQLKKDDFGIWAETQLALRDEYERFIYAQTEAGKMGWSSGVPAHLIERKPEGKGTLITMWHIAEASLTPTPAEPRNSVTPLKSYKPIALDLQAEPEDAGQLASAQATVTTATNVKTTTIEVQPSKDKSDMEAQEYKSMFDAALTPLQETIKAQGVELENIKGILKKEAPINKDGGVDTTVKVIGDPADVPFKTIAENARAVKQFVTSNGRIVAPRIKKLMYDTVEEYEADQKSGNFKAAQGASEVSPTDGGILLDPTLTSMFLGPLHQAGSLYDKVTKMPVSANSNYGWINGIDETSRVTGSRWGGVQGYRVAEAGSLTKSKPKFRRIQWELKKYVTLVYGTDELLADSAQFSAIVNQACAEELMFMINDDIFEGLGLSGAQGIMTNGALISVTRDSGSAIKGADISGMWNRLNPASRSRAEWFVGNDSLPQLDNLFAVGSTAVLYPYASIGADGIQRLYGRPVNVTEYNATLNTTGDILLADLSQYLLWEKAGIQGDTSIHVQFTTDETVFRFIMRADGQSAQYSALTPFKGSTTTSPWVVLGSAT